MEKDTYGLSEGVFKACQFLGLKFPQQAIDKPQPTPSDYFGDDIELNPEIFRKLRSERQWSEQKLKSQYEKFQAKFLIQRPLKQSRTDLNVYFCDYVLFANNQDGSDAKDYFNFEYYNKSFELRRTFTTRRRRDLMMINCNDRAFLPITENKVQTNRFFFNFIHRDWLDTHTCSFEEFKSFVGKHSRFFSKLRNAGQGRGAEVITLDPKENLEEIFQRFKEEPRLLEEIVSQHQDLAAFCPDSVNTVRIYTLLDIHNVVHIMTATGRFGRVSGIIDNFSQGGMAAIIDPKTGIITSDGINQYHERMKAHPDTGKVFKGFQYPAWKKLCATVIEMAKMLPQVRYIGWDIAINDKTEIVVIETNAKFVGAGIQQTADNVGRFPLYRPLVEEIKQYNREQMRLMGYRVNNLKHFNYSRDRQVLKDSQLQFALDKLIPGCKSLIHLGCGESNFVESTCPSGVEYSPVDFKAYRENVIARDFNKGSFPKIKANVCLCALTAEYVEALPQFLAKMCAATRKQILMLCKPIDKEVHHIERWLNPLLVDFTEEFLIKTLAQNNFQLTAQVALPDDDSMFLYDFRKASL